MDDEVRKSEDGDDVEDNDRDDEMECGGVTKDVVEEE